eukprot:6878837-Karenia_brevis.AAC.1
MNVRPESSKSPPWPYSGAPLSQTAVKPPPKLYSESPARHKGVMGGGGSSPAFKNPPPPRGDRPPPPYKSPPKPA